LEVEEEISRETRTGISDFRPHDFRRTVEINITKPNYSHFIAGKIVNHIQGGVGKIYDRHDYLKEKTEALQTWSDHLSKLLGLKHSS
jgi:hypothetical protein